MQCGTKGAVSGWRGRARGAAAEARQDGGSGQDGAAGSGQRARAQTCNAICAFSTRFPSRVRGIQYSAGEIMLCIGCGMTICVDRARAGQALSGAAATCFATVAWRAAAAAGGANRVVGLDHAAGVVLALG